MKLFKYSCPGKDDVYLAFDQHGYICYTVYFVECKWVLEDNNQGYIQGEDTDIDTLLDKWKNVFSL